MARTSKKAYAAASETANRAMAAKHKKEGATAGGTQRSYNRAMHKYGASVAMKKHGVKLAAMGGDKG
jgi:hypothetical protein